MGGCILFIGGNHIKTVREPKTSSGDRSFEKRWSGYATAFLEHIKVNSILKNNLVQESGLFRF